MAAIAPFRGLRYDPQAVNDWGALLGPPYDIVDAAQTAALKAASPWQIAHLETASGDDGIAAAAAALRDWQAQGVIVREDEPSLYLHEHRFEMNGATHSRRALFAAVALSEWGADGVMAHEHTMPGPKATRTALRSVVGADVSPLMAFAPDRGGQIAALMDAAAALPPLAEGVDPSGDSHSLRRIAGAAAAELQAAFSDEQIYMADGHHRYESALASRDARPGSRYVLMGIVTASDPGLIVGATHRVVLTGAPSDLRDRLAAMFSVSASERGDLGAELPAGSARVAMIASDSDQALVLEPTEAAFAQLPPSLPDSWRSLAPALLQYAILEPIFGIDAAVLAGGGAVRYTHHADEVFSAVDAGDASCAFMLPAPTLDDVFASADAGDRMPQKSTYFVPKLPTGLVLHALD